MVKAPRPGVTKKPKRAAIRITVEGDTCTLYMADLSPEDDLLARKETGYPVSPFINDERFGADSFALLWWMARRKRGERRLRFREVLKEMPGVVELGEMLDDGRIEFEAIEEGDEDVIDVEEAGPDPLPSGAV